MARFDLLDPEQAPKGVAAFLKTPFLGDRSLDEASFSRTAEHLADIGVSLAITGMVGSETYALSDAERVRSLEIAIDICADRVPLCVAVVGASIPDVVDAARRADGMGADMIAVVPPAWSRSEADIATCIQTVAAAVGSPIMVHSIGGAGVILSVDLLERLPTRAPNVVYLKEEAPFAPRRVADLLARPGGAAYLTIMGGQPLVVSYLAGARLFMIAGDLPEPFQAVFDALEAGDLDEARRIDALINAVAFFERDHVRGEFQNKAIMHRRGLFASPRIADPSVSGGLTAFTPAEEDSLTELLRPLLPFFSKYPPKPPT